MVDTPGKCLSPSCDVARSGEPVLVSVGADFVCPSCGEELYAPFLSNSGRFARPRSWASPLVCCVVAGGYVAALAGGFAAGRAGSPAPAQSPHLEATPGSFTPAVEARSGAQPVLPAKSAQSAQAGAILVSPAADEIGQYQAFTPVPETASAPVYPAEMLADGRTGRVMVTCRIGIDGVPRECRAGRAPQPFVSAALAWLRHGHVRFHPVVQGGHAVAVTRSWTVVIAKPAAQTTGGAATSTSALLGSGRDSLSVSASGADTIAFSPGP